MSVLSKVAARPAGGPAAVNVYRGLLWREWLAHRSLAINASAVWLACGWVLLLFHHPGYIIAFGVLYAFLAGPAFGGSEAGEGSEEFSFALPPTRPERYLARLALGSGTVLGFTVLGVLTIALDLPQMLWGLVVSSGFTEPFPPCEERFLYLLAVAIPFGVFAFSFAIASVAGTRGLVGMAWLLGGLIAGAVLSLGFAGERLLWGELNGYVSVLALCALAPAGVLAGYLRYVHKEGVSRPTPLRGGGSWWVWLIVLGIILLLFMLLFIPYVAVREGEMDRAQRRRADVAAQEETLQHRESTEAAPRALPGQPEAAPAPDEGR